jgi:hypothetical protein
VFTVFFLLCSSSVGVHTFNGGGGGGGEQQDEYSIILLNPCKRALENARTGAEGTTVEPRWQYHYNYDGAPTQGKDTHTRALSHHSRLQHPTTNNFWVVTNGTDTRDLFIYFFCSMGV